MIDTVCLVSPPIANDLFIELEKVILRKKAIYKGNIVYSFDTIPYINTYQRKININVLDEKWVYNSITGTAEKIKCKKYIKIEGSLHKYFLGHNCYGGSDNLIYQFSNMLKKIKIDLELKLEFPCAENWIIDRIDYARIYRLKNNEYVENYFNSFQNIHYPRGQVLVKQGESIYRAGRTTTIKAYNKLAEFKKHDYKWWKKYAPKEAELIKNNTEGIIRYEVEIKKRKLKYDFNKDVLVKDIDVKYMRNVLEVELKRLLNEGEYMRKELKDNEKVRLFLFNVLEKNQFNVVYGFYNDLAINGYEIVRKSMPKSTFYKRLNILKKYGINYKNTNISLNINNYEFNPFTAMPDDTDMIAV